MNIAKNMEAIFFVAIALIGITSYASAAVPAHHAARVAAAAQSTDSHMQVVVVKAKRLSALEKAQLAN